MQNNSDGSVTAAYHRGKDKDPLKLEYYFKVIYVNFGCPINERLRSVNEYQKHILAGIK